MSASTAGLGRRISSVSVTYQAFHGPPAAEQMVANSNASSRVRPLPCEVPGDQNLEDVCKEFADVEPPSPDRFYPQAVLTQLAPSHPPSLPPSHIPPSLTSARPVCTYQPQGAIVTEQPLSNPAARHDGSLFALEDALRYRVNTELEAFRAAVQQILREQFSVHQCSSGTEHTYRGYRGCHTGPEGLTPVVPEGEEQEMFQTASVMQTHYDEAHVSSQEGSVCSNNGGSSGTSDSGVVGGDPSSSLDREMDQCLIRLQTLASVISTTLRRSEYSTLNT